MKARPQAPVSTGLIQGLHFRSQDQQKHMKMTINHYLKNAHPKTPTLMPKGSQKGRQTLFPKFQKILPNQISENIMKFIKNHMLLNCKIIQIHCKNNIMQVACASGKGIKKTSKMKAKSFLTSIQNRCENDAQTNDANIIENCAKMDPQR